jgi:hypothetical protein
VSWHRNDELLLEGERFHFVHEGNFFCVDVAPVMVEDGGRWTCMAEGAGGRTSCSSNLNVLGESEGYIVMYSIVPSHRTSLFLLIPVVPEFNLYPGERLPILVVRGFPQV